MSRLRPWTFVLAAGWAGLAAAAVDAWRRLDPFCSPLRRNVDGLLAPVRRLRAVDLGSLDLLALLLIVAGAVTATTLRRRFLRRHS